MNEPALDASAVLALLNKEQGHEQVLAVLPAAAIGTVNLTKVISKPCERNLTPRCKRSKSYRRQVTRYGLSECGRAAMEQAMSRLVLDIQDQQQ